MGLNIQTNCGSCSQMSPFSMLIFLLIILSTVLSTIAAEPFTTPTPENNCTEPCETCVDINDSNSCLTCQNNLTLNPMENCTDILMACGSDECMAKCNDTFDCQCLLKNQDICQDCMDELDNLYGTCVKPDACPRNTQKSDDVLEYIDGQNKSISVCLECDNIRLGYCVERYILHFVLIPIGVFIFLSLLVGVVLVLCRKRGAESECSSCCTLQSDKPPAPIERDYRTPSKQQNYQMDHRNDDNGEAKADDIYGNVDDQNNVMLHNAPLQQQIDPRDRPPMQPPTSPGHARLPPGNARLPPVPTNALLPPSNTHAMLRTDNSEGQRLNDPGYIKMKDNVIVNQPRYPPGATRHTIESETDDQPVYDNDPIISRQASAPARRPPSLPKVQPTSSTFPAGISSSVLGRINKGFNDDDEDDDPHDDYPDYPQDEDHLDSIPQDYAPPPPVNHNRGGGGNVQNELQQKLNSRLQKHRKESLSDLPEEPPPPVPSQGGRHLGGGGHSGGAGQMSELQQKLKFCNAVRNNSLSDIPDEPPPPRPSQTRTVHPVAQSGQGMSMSELQQKFSNSFLSHLDGNKKPNLPKPPVKAKVHQTQQDSDSEQDEYEVLDNQDDHTSNTIQQNQRSPDVNIQPILPKSPTRMDPSNKPRVPFKQTRMDPPQVPFKKNPVMPPKKNPPPLPKSPKPVEEEQEVYEVVDNPEDKMTDRPRMPAPSDSFRDIRDKPHMSIPTEDRPRMPPPVQDRLHMPPPVPGNKPSPVIMDDEVYEAVESPDPKDYGENYEVPEGPKVQLECDDVYQNEPVIKGKAGRYRNLPADRNQPVIGGGSGYTKWTGRPR